MFLLTSSDFSPYCSDTEGCQDIVTLPLGVVRDVTYHSNDYTDNRL